MKKEKNYYRTRFDAAVIEEASKVMDSLWTAEDKKRSHIAIMSVSIGDETWKYDNLQELLGDWDKGEVANYHAAGGSRALDILFTGTWSTVGVQSPSREEIQRVFNVFEKYAPKCVLPLPKTESKPLKIFIGHGGSQQWRDLKDHLQDKHRYDVEAYEIGARAGHTIRDILEDMLEKSSIAFLVLTGEDEMADGKLLARQNVIHEAGLFQGRLGFSKAVVLLEEGTEKFSNIAGVQQVRFAKGHIKETFGDVLAVLRREFGAAE